MMNCQALRNDGRILCIKRDCACFNTDVTEETCNRCQSGEPVQPVPIDTPPFKAGRDREFIIDQDETILYAEDASFAEPPRDIDGYDRDPHNPLRFISRWLPCQYRVSTAIRFAACGCLGFLHQCNDSNSLRFATRVDHAACVVCRKTFKIPLDSHPYV